MHPSPDPLDDLLDRCRATPEPPARLAAEVRRRLATAAPARPAAPDWLARLEAVFARPSFAAAFIAACVLFGLFLAEARLSRLHAARSAEMARSYLKLVDPLVATAPTPPPAQ